jgi:hypothetical protein
MSFHKSVDQHPGIISPFYLQAKSYPYILGPNYTRPVFKQHSSSNFKFQPIVRMPSLGSSDEPFPFPDIEGMNTDQIGSGGMSCENNKKYPEVHKACLDFNKKLSETTGEEQNKLFEMTFAAIEKCIELKDEQEGYECMYTNLGYKLGELKWYHNPMYLGLAIMGGIVAAGIAVSVVRKG